MERKEKVKKNGPEPKPQDQEKGNSHSEASLLFRHTAPC